MDWRFPVRSSEASESKRFASTTWHPFLIATFLGVLRYIKTDSP